MSLDVEPLSRPIPGPAEPNRELSGDSTPSSAADLPTIWGFDLIQLHTRYWASLGVQVVRQGEPSEIVSHAELYLLTDSHSLVLFSLSRMMEVLNWIKPLVVFVRIRDPRQRDLQQQAACDFSGRFLRFSDSPQQACLPRVVVTPDVEVARLWQSAPDAATGWHRLRRFTPRIDRITLSLPGQVFAREKRDELALLSRQLVRAWKRPDSIVARANRMGNSAWIDREAKSNVAADVSVVGPVWIGAGRTIPKGSKLIGPKILWDDPGARPPTEPIEWLLIEPAESEPRHDSLWKNAQHLLRRMTRS